MNGDCVTSKLSLSKLNGALSSLGSTYYDYFRNKYEVKDISNVQNAVKNNLNMSKFSMNQILKRLSTNLVVKDLHH